MKKYYKIPMTERALSISDKRIIDILQDNYPELYNREVNRVELTYGNSKTTPLIEQGTDIESYNRETDALYKQMGVPSHIIAYSDEADGVFEYATSEKIQAPKSDTIFKMRIVSKQAATEFLTQEKNYFEVVSRMFIKKGGPKSLLKSNKASADSK